MDFGLSQEISKDVALKADIFTTVSKSLENYFSNRDYGKGIEKLTIGIICVSTEFDFFFKERKKYTKTKAMLEYDIKLDHETIVEANEREVYQILSNSIIESLEIINEMKIPNFDNSGFRAEVASFLNNRLRRTIQWS